MTKVAAPFCNFAPRNVVRFAILRPETWYVLQFCAQKRGTFAILRPETWYVLQFCALKRGTFCNFAPRNVVLFASNFITIFIFIKNFHNQKKKS